MAYTELPHQQMVRRWQGYPSIDRKERISLSREPFVVWSPLVVRSGGSASTKLFEAIPFALNIPLFSIFFSLSKNREIHLEPSESREDSTMPQVPRGPPPEKLHPSPPHPSQVHSEPTGQLMPPNHSQPGRLIKQKQLSKTCLIFLLL